MTSWKNVNVAHLVPQHNKHHTPTVWLQAALCEQNISAVCRNWDLQGILSRQSKANCAIVVITSCIRFPHNIQLQSHCNAFNCGSSKPQVPALKLGVLGGLRKPLRELEFRPSETEKTGELWSFCILPTYRCFPKHRLTASAHRCFANPAPPNLWTAKYQVSSFWYHIFGGSQKNCL